MSVSKKKNASLQARQTPRTNSTSKNAVATVARSRISPRDSKSLAVPVYQLRGRIVTIETIRVLLTLWVLQHHFLVSYCHHDWKERVLGNFFGTISRGLSMNNQAVPYAFVAISGFTTHWTSRHVDLTSWSAMGAFIKRRVSRVYLAYLAAFIASMLTIWPSVVGESENSAVGAATVEEHLWRAAPSFFTLQAWFSFVDADFTFVHTLYPNIAAWTVSSLIFCWVIYPIYIRVLLPRHNTKLCVNGILFWSFFMYLCFRTWPGEDRREQTRSGVFQGFFWFPPMIIPQFAVGIYYAEIAATFVTRREKEKTTANEENKTSSVFMNNRMTSLLSCLAVGTYFWLNMYDTDIKLGAGYQYVGWFRMHLVMIAVFLTAIGSEAYFFGQSASWPLWALGEYTLHIYLWQFPIMRLFYRFLTTRRNLVVWPIFFQVEACLIGFVGVILWSIFYVKVVERRIIAGRFHRRGVDTKEDQKFEVDDAKKGA